MGMQLTLSDRELPVSPAFVTFLAHQLARRTIDDQVWSDQRSELLAYPEHDAPRIANEAAAAVMASAEGRAWLARSYGLLFALLAGDPAPFTALQARFHFVNIVGIPRTGGSYLTAEIFRAVGMRPERVPSAIAHDSFPEASPFELRPGINGWMVSLKTMAEYLTMVEVFFADRPTHGGRIVVPKKLTKAVYAPGLFQRVLGESAEHVLTVRHPAAGCVSTYEKSGGLPLDGRFAVRSNIEEWCRRDLRYTGCGAAELERMDYFDAYLRYWEQYHLMMATSAWAAPRALRIVPFGRLALEAHAQGYHDRFSSGLLAPEFHVSDAARRRHPEWIEKGDRSIDRIAQAWRVVGLEFPADEVRACW